MLTVKDWLDLEKQKENNMARDAPARVSDSGPLAGSGQGPWPGPLPPDTRAGLSVSGNQQSRREPVCVRARACAIKPLSW